MPRNMPERDDLGRFISDDDRCRGGGRRHYAENLRDDDYRRSGRYDDDDRGRGHGGWFGDPQGHAEAARRGWDERRDDRDDGRRSYSSRDDDRRYASRDDDRRSSGGGHGGWFGDPEGHSEASRRGWEERRDYEYDDRRRR